MKRFLFPVIALILFFGFPGLTLAQKSKELNRADKYYKDGNYSKAKNIYQSAINSGNVNAIIYYRMGLILYKDNNLSERIKSITFFEKAIESNQVEIPPESHLFLADMYHKDSNIEKAMNEIMLYESKDKRDPDYSNKALKLMSECRNALFQLKSEREYLINLI